jgi:cytochrome P450
MSTPSPTGQPSSARKVDRGDPAAKCPVHPNADAVWQVHGYAAGRAVLRSSETVQAGMGVENAEKLPKKMRPPVIYRDGAEHREHRRQTARYFTPRRVDEHYRDLMVRVADAQIARLRRAGSAHLSDLSFALAVDVAAGVIGLTESRRGLDRRLERVFPEKTGKPGFSSASGLYWFLRSNFVMLAFYLADVRPAVSVRRRTGRDDLISHLIGEGCNDLEILGECLTVAAAGMITTREFINVAAWHLFTDAGLLERYRGADEAGRLAVLHEVLRLEPVVGSLRRRTTAPVEIPGADGPVVIPAGELIEVVVSGTNVDPDAVGANPLAVCPARELADGVGSAGLSFGEGPHRCPGAHIAIQESDIFLRRLFALNGLRMAGSPRVSIKEQISSYELRGLIVSLDLEQLPSGAETGAP